MSESIALIDLGSNAVRCVLATVVPGVGFQVLYEERFQTRLSNGRPGELSRVAVEKTVAAIQHFLGTVRRQYNPQVLAVATSAVRDATNRACLLDPLRQREGIEVRVLSGQEEARLGAIAVLRSLSIDTGMIADLGGGSLQLSLAQEGEIISTASLPLGAVRMTKRFFAHDPPTAQELSALRREIRSRVATVLPAARPSAPFVGIGGTVRTLASMHLTDENGQRPSRQGVGLLQADITRLRKQLEALPIRARRLPGLKEERADIILAGTIVIEEVMALGGFAALTVCTAGVRHGILVCHTFNGGM
jgi:exopolyphosphatase/guanosine-5'-triphosphate,3'-diphosphate pyrophosphatase